jgi:hypothetical protein
MNECVWSSIRKVITGDNRSRLKRKTCPSVNYQSYEYIGQWFFGYTNNI